MELLAHVIVFPQPSIMFMHDMAPGRRPQKHVCNKCNRSFPSGRALGGHMSRHWRSVEQPKSMPSPTAIVTNLHVSLLSPSDEKPLLPSSGAQCQLCSNVFSTCKSLREHMRKHSEKKVVTKLVEQAAGLMEAPAVTDGDCNVMLSPPVKRKRSKRETAALNFDEIVAAVTLLLLSEHSDETSAYEDCYGGDKKGDNLEPNLLKDVRLDAFDHLLARSVEFKKPTIDKNSACDDCYGQCEKDDSLISNVPKDNLSIPNVPEKEVDLTEFDHGLAGDAELMKPRTDNSVEEMNWCGDLSAAVKAKGHQCNACGKSFRSGQALGGHMRCHYPRSNHRHQRFAYCPDSAVIKEQQQKLQLDSELPDLRLPALTDGGYTCSGLKSETEPWRVASSVH